MIVEARSNSLFGVAEYMAGYSWSGESRRFIWQPTLETADYSLYAHSRQISAAFDDSFLMEGKHAESLRTTSKCLAFYLIQKWEKKSAILN